MSVNGSSPESCISGRGSAAGAADISADGLGDGADMLRRRAAAAADDVDQAFAREVFDLGRHEFRALVVLAERVGQAGIRIGAGEGVGDAGKLGQMRRAWPRHPARN